MARRIGAQMKLTTVVNVERADISLLHTGTICLDVIKTIIAENTDD